MTRRKRRPCKVHGSCRGCAAASPRTLGQTIRRLVVQGNRVNKVNTSTADIVDGFAARVQKAIDDALATQHKAADGFLERVTATGEFRSLQAEVDALKASAAKLKRAMRANPVPVAPGRKRRMRKRRKRHVVARRKR